MKSLKEIIDELFELCLIFYNSGAMLEEEQKNLKDLLIQYQTYYENDLIKENKEEKENG